MALTISVFGGNLGDILWTTPLARYEPNLIVRLREGDAKVKATAPVLQGVVAVVTFEPSPPETAQAPIHAHVTQRILAAYGHAGRPSVPRIILTAAEIRAALDRLLPLGLSPESCAVVNHNSANGDPTNHRAHYVRPPSEVMHRLASFHMKGGRAKVFQFGPAPGFYTWDPFDPIPGAIHIRGLSVRELAACYHVIGKVISGDTGDMWLALAVGAKVACLVPPHSDVMGYRHWDLHLDAVCWGNELPRIRYALHHDWLSFASTDLFRSIGSPSAAPDLAAPIAQPFTQLPS